jgi:signal transduction histidine kinase
VERFFYLAPVMGEVRGLYPLTEKPQLVGRSERAGIVLREPTVSRRHARIYVRDAEVHLEDLGSKHGTFVNSRRVQQVRLKPGDLVVFGLAMVLRLEEGDTPVEAQRPEIGPAFSNEEPSMTLTQRELSRKAPVSPADASGLEEMAPVRDHALKLTRLGGLTLELLPSLYGQLSQLSNLAGAERVDLETVRGAIKSILRMVTQLVEVGARIVPEPRTPVALVEVVQQAIERVSEDFERRQIAVDSRVPAQLKVRLDSEQMSAALSGLLTNAGNQSPDGALVEVVARSDANGVVLKIADQGYGYPEEILNQAFDPLGSALADPAAIRLWEARRAVVALGGMLTVKSNEGVGAVVRIILPMASR